MSDVVERLPRRGDKVRIPKGAYIRCLHPSGDRLARRSQVVTVSHTFEYPRFEVSWAGAGGYWCNAWEWELIQ